MLRGNVHLHSRRYERIRSGEFAGLNPVGSFTFDEGLQANGSVDRLAYMTALSFRLNLGGSSQKGRRAAAGADDDAATILPRVAVLLAFMPAVMIAVGVSKRQTNIEALRRKNSTSYRQHIDKYNITLSSSETTSAKSAAGLVGR